MPEGDTVLRTARRLDQALSGHELTRTELRWPTLGGVDLGGRQVLETTAYGKHILTRLAGVPDRQPPGAAATTAAARIGPGATATAPRVPTAPDVPLTLRSHLRMDGSWVITPPGPALWPRSTGPRVRAILGTADWTAVGMWLGLLDLVPTDQEHTLIGHLGPDIMTDAFATDDPGSGSAEAIRRLALAPDRTIGSALLDQTTVAGIGTMYMAETLFLQRISPWIPVAEVDLAAVLGRARALLLQGVKNAIPSTTGFTARGREVWVHARSGKPCHRCGTTVRVAMVGVAPRERTAFYCPSCQPGPTPTDDHRVQRPIGSNPAHQQNRNPAGYRPRR